MFSSMNVKIGKKSNNTLKTNNTLKLMSIKITLINVFDYNHCSVPSMVLLVSLLSLMCCLSQIVLCLPHIQHIRNVTVNDCGLTRHSDLLDDLCFRWHRMVYANNEIHFGRNASITELPFMAYVYALIPFEGIMLRY